MADKILKGIEVGGETYSIPTGSEVSANGTLQGGEPTLKSLKVDNQTYALDGILYTTTAPVADNTDGTIKIALLSAEPAVKYDGWIYIIVVAYNITSQITNGSATGAVKIKENGRATVTIAPDSGYKMPSSVVVMGASYTYDSSTGEVVLSNPTGDVYVTAYCEPNTHKISLKARSTAIGSDTYNWGFALTGVNNFGTKVFDSDSVDNNAVLEISYNYVSSGDYNTITVYLNGAVAEQQSGSTINLTYQLPITTDTIIEMDNNDVYITTNATGLDAPIMNIYCQWTSPSGSYYLKHLVNNLAAYGISSIGTVLTARKFGIQGYNWTSSAKTFGTSIYDSYPGGTKVDSVSTGSVPTFSTGPAIDVTSKLHDGYAWS